MPKNLAFTLIEILLVVGITLAVTGLVAPGFSRYLRNQFVKQAQRQIKSDLSLAQSRAFASDRSIGADGEIDPIMPTAYWGVKFLDGGSTYETFTSADAGDFVCNTTVQRTAQGNSTLPSRVQIRLPSSSRACVFFSLRNGDAYSYGLNDCPAPVTGKCVFVSYESGNDCRFISVNQNGLIVAGAEPESCP